MVTNNKLNEQNNLLELHLKVLKEILNGMGFKEIKMKYSIPFQEHNYLQKVDGNLLTFEDDILVGAYPVSPKITNYKVTIDDVGTGYAMCAIDALGIAYTFMKKTRIKTIFLDTNESFVLEINPFSKEQPKYNFFVTYIKQNSDITNAALQQCPSINVYQSEKNIPNKENLIVMDFEAALSYAKMRFSQETIIQCLLGKFNQEKFSDNYNFIKQF